MNVGSIVWSTDQGLGNLAKDFYDHGIFNKVAVVQHTSRHNHNEAWYPEHLKLFGRPFIRMEGFAEWLRSLKCLLLFETPFDWEVIQFAKAHGIKCILMTMYEWTPKTLPHEPDWFLCPSLLDLDYFKHTKKASHIPVPVPDQIPYQLRTEAKRFLHNGGNLGVNGGRGTPELLQALRYINKEIQFTIRSQDRQELGKYLRQSPWVERLPNVKIEIGTKPYLELWNGYDVLVAPEKYNGLSLPLQEAKAAGMFVLTTDRYPTNTWLWGKDDRDGLGRYIAPTGEQRGSVGGPYNEINISTLDPSEIARAINDTYTTSIQQFSEQAVVWRKEMSWETLGPKYEQLIEEVCNG
jgi:hypothetical protein